MTYLFLNKLWSVAKPYTIQFAVVVGVGGALFFYFKQVKDTMVDKLQEQQKIHDTAITKIEEAQYLERKTREVNIRQLQASLEDIQKKYDEDLKALEKKKSAQVTSLVQQYEEDPTAMAKKLSELTGFRLVTPGEVK